MALQARTPHPLEQVTLTMELGDHLQVQMVLAAAVVVEDQLALLLELQVTLQDTQFTVVAVAVGK
jgi:hypothetical protein